MEFTIMEFIRLQKYPKHFIGDIMDIINYYFTIIGYLKQVLILNIFSYSVIIFIIIRSLILLIFFF